MKYEIEITQSAQSDFENIYSYISESLCNRQAASNLIKLIDKDINTLAQVPEAYPLVNDEYLRNIGIRFISVKNYIVFYTVNISKQKVYILRVLYGKRNWVDILQSEL
ncbi:MAG: type II toxin-antitoxin system RelE/ParE family toxin [Clostridia bacterium]|nr:type II toxin-antitoxin system RelE/ParE family toxin [Clostridia bacterium]